MTVGRIAITTEEMLSNEAIAHLTTTPKTPFCKEYLYLFFKLYKFESLGSTSSVVTAINSAMIKDIEITIPDNTAMIEFCEKASTFFNKIRSNQSQISTLAKIRNTLLPKLISNQIKQ